MKRLDLRLLSLLLMLIVASVFSGCSVYRNVTLYPALQDADNRFEQRQYMVARAMYERLIKEMPEGKTRQRLMIRIGDCYYNEAIKSLHDARIAYTQYLENYPSGRYAPLAREHIQHLNTIAANRGKEAEDQRDEMVQKLEGIRAEIAKDPNNKDLYNSADLHIRLADSLWGLKRYDEAVQAYMEAQSIDPANVDLVKAMEERTVTDKKTGHIVPLTPQMEQELDAERKPLVFFNLYAYNSRLSQDFLSSREVYYNVQGLVRNQSKRTLHNVVVQVRFLNPASNQLDYKRDNIGTLPPGAVRAFGVRADRYDSIYNIADYECTAFYSE